MRCANELNETRNMQILALNFLVCAVSGIWRPIEWSSNGVKLLYNIYTFFVLVSLYFFTITQFLDIVLAADIDRIVSSSLYFVSMIAVCCKATVVVTRRNAIYNLVQTLLTEPCKPQEEDEVTIQGKFDEFIRSCTTKYSFLATGSVTNITAMSVVKAMQGLLPYYVWLPYDTNVPSLFWITSIHQMIVIIFATVVNVATETLVFGFILQTCAQLEIFECRLHKIATSEVVRSLSSSLSSKTTSLISRYIRHHLKIYKYAKSVNSIFSEVLFCQFCGSILVLCTSVYFLSTHITDSEAIGFMVFTVCMFVQIYIYCWSGNEVILKSLSIGDAVYQMDWTLLSLSERKDLLMIMKRSTIPIKFTSSFLITLSLQSYSNILKMSYSAFNLLKE